MPEEYDLVILGSGTTAFAGGRLAAANGKRVLMVEQSHLGGTCVNWGCVPSKSLIHKAEMYHGARKGRAWGLNLHAGSPDCPTLMRLKREAVETLRESHYQFELNHTEGLEVLQGHGRFISPHEIEVGAEIVRGKDILIATGGIPRVVPIPGLDQVNYLTSYSALHLPCFPKSLIMLGGGVISLEMGQMFARFGTEVTILERGPKLLAEFDPRLTEQFRALLEHEGVRVMFNFETERVEKRGEQTSLYGRINGSSVGMSAERLMLAVGTQPASKGLGLEEVGVELDPAGFIKVDPQLRTSIPGIWAAGDVTGPPLIAPAGAREAHVAVQNMLNPDAGHSIDHRFSPMAVFVDPEFATVGLTHDQALEKGLEPVTTYLALERVPKTHVMNELQGGVLLTAEKHTGRILGVQMLAPRAADIIHEATLAVRFGLTVCDLVTTVHVYPSISDGLRLAARDNARLQGLM